MQHAPRAKPDMLSWDPTQNTPLRQAGAEVEEGSPRPTVWVTRPCSHTAQPTKPSEETPKVTVSVTPLVSHTPPSQPHRGLWKYHLWEPFQGSICNQGSEMAKGLFSPLVSRKMRQGDPFLLTLRGRKLGQAPLHEKASGRIGENWGLS